MTPKAPVFVRARIRIARLRIAATSRALGAIANVKNRVDVAAVRRAKAAEKNRRIVERQRAAAMKKKAELEALAARKRQELKVALTRSATFSKLVGLVGAASSGGGGGRSGRANSVAPRSRVPTKPAARSDSVMAPGRPGSGGSAAATASALLNRGRQRFATAGAADAAQAAAPRAGPAAALLRTASASPGRLRLQGAARAVGSKATMRPAGSAGPRIAELFVETIAPEQAGPGKIVDGGAGPQAGDPTAVDLSMFFFLGGRRARRYDVLAQAMGNQRRQVLARAGSVMLVASASARALLDGSAARDAVSSWSQRRLEARVAAAAWVPDIAMWRSMGGRVAVFSAIDDRPTAVDISVFMYLGGNTAPRPRPLPLSTRIARVGSVQLLGGAGASSSAAVPTQAGFMPPAAATATAVTPAAVVVPKMMHVVDLTYWEFLGGHRAVSQGRGR